MDSTLIFTEITIEGCHIEDAPVGGEGNTFISGYSGCEG